MISGRNFVMLFLCCQSCSTYYPEDALLVSRVGHCENKIKLLIHHSYPESTGFELIRPDKYFIVLSRAD